MRNIALTFLGCFTILAACSNSDDAEKPVTPVPTGDVTIYATTSSLTRDLTRDAVNFSSKDNLAPTSITFFFMPVFSAIAATNSALFIIIPPQLS